MKNKKQKATKTKTKFKNYTKAFLLLCTIFFIGYTVINPIPTSSSEVPCYAYTRLPIAEDRTNLTDFDKILIEATLQCNARKLGRQCINDIMGMAWTESRFDCKANGDFGASHGCLQISLGYHKHVTQVEARDPKFAVNWTLDRMINYGYPEYRKYSIRRHNGSAKNPATLKYYNSVNNY